MARGTKRKIEDEGKGDDSSSSSAPVPSLNRTKTMQETLKVAKDYLKRVGYEVEEPAAPVIPERRETRSMRKPEPAKAPEPEPEPASTSAAPKAPAAPKGKRKALEELPPAAPALSVLNKSRSLLEFYTENAGKHEVEGGYGGAEHDLGKNNAFASFSILLMNFNQEAPLNEIFALAHEALHQKGFSVVEINKEEEFLDYIHHFDEVWVASSDQPCKNPDKVVQELRKFHAAGKGIGIWAGGNPYIAQANLILKDLLNVEVTDSYAGKGSLKLVGLGDQATEPGTLARSLVTTGLTEIPEGGVYCRLADVPQNAQILARSARAFPTLLAWEGSSHSGRILLSCSLVSALKNDDQLVPEKRLLSNIGVWLLGLDDRMKLGVALVGDIQTKHNITWEYFLDRNMDGKIAGWHPYDQQANTIVEAAYQKYVNSDQADNNIRAFITVHSGSFSYEVDFKTMTQKNIAHQAHKVRKIRRVGDEN